MNNQAILETATAAARSGADILRRYASEGFSVRSKGGPDLVTNADLESEKAVAEIIAARFPNHSLLGEEEHQADLSAEHLWIVDPLDGTTNFAHGIPHFAVSVAYYREGRPVAGVVLNPMTNDLFRACSGEGAFHNDREIRVHSSDRMLDALIGTGFYYDRGAMMEATLAALGDCFRRGIHGIRRFGTASLDLCQVAGGRYGAFFEFQLSPWDFAAGRLIVEEAGGHVTTCRGEDLPLQKVSLLASNSRLHPELLEILHPHITSLQDR